MFFFQGGNLIKAEKNIPLQMLLKVQDMAVETQQSAPYPHVLHYPLQFSQNTFSAWLGMLQQIVSKSLVSS